MKLKNKTIPETEWHKWFAWYPVRTEENETIWLQEVYRKLVFHYMDDYYLYSLKGGLK